MDALFEIIRACSYGEGGPSTVSVSLMSQNTGGGSAFFRSSDAADFFSIQVLTDDAAQMQPEEELEKRYIRLQRAATALGAVMKIEMSDGSQVVITPTTEIEKNLGLQQQHHGEGAPPSSLLLLSPFEFQQKMEMDPSWVSMSVSLVVKADQMLHPKVLNRFMQIFASIQSFHLSVGFQSSFVSWWSLKQHENENEFEEEGFGSDETAVITNSSSPHCIRVADALVASFGRIRARWTSDEISHSNSKKICAISGVMAPRKISELGEKNDGSMISIALDGAPVSPRLAIAIVQLLLQ